MATTKQRQAAQQNIKKAQAKWKSMTSRQHSLAQPEGRERAKPGTKGGGQYFRVVVGPKEQFATFRYQDIGEPGHLQRLAGKRESGSWATQAWLISKEDAHKEGSTLVPDTTDAKDLLKKLGSKPMHVKGDIFEAKDRPNVPEKDKPTTKQKRARAENIKKAHKPPATNKHRDMMVKRSITASDLGLRLSPNNDKEIFKWFLAAYLFGKRIQQEIASKTWQVFMANGLDSPREIAKCTWQQLVDYLGEGHYVRYDESTASYLLEMSRDLIDRYSGKLTNLRDKSHSRQEFEQKLMKLKGVGPKTTEIFMREIKPLWF